MVVICGGYRKIIAYRLGGFPKYLENQLYNAIVESYASELAARLVSMKNATKSAGEMMDSLTLTYNKARQAGITKEILEIISGAEALKG